MEVRALSEPVADSAVASPPMVFGDRLISPPHRSAPALGLALDPRLSRGEEPCGRGIDNAVAGQPCQDANAGVVQQGEAVAAGGHLQRPIDGQHRRRDCENGDQGEEADHAASSSTAGS